MHEARRMKQCSAKKGHFVCIILACTCDLITESVAQTTKVGASYSGEGEIDHINCLAI